MTATQTAILDAWTVYATAYQAAIALEDANAREDAIAAAWAVADQAADDYTTAREAAVETANREFEQAQRQYDAISR